ncbi:hypothetical protein JCM3765_003621 [Sporobolomyces pararoseus]
MSIFASTSGPALIQIPSFSSPERPAQLQEREQSSEDESTKQPQTRPQALTRDEERQMRKWESLGRMIEQQKASGSSSLLQLMGSSVDLSAALGGKGKEKAKDSGSKRTRKSTRDTGTRQEESLVTRKSVSPVKRKREDKKRPEKEDISKIDVGPSNRSTREQEHSRGRIDERDILEGGGRPAKKAESSKLTTTSDSRTSSLPLPLPLPAASGSALPPHSATSDSKEATTKKPKGRVPRAAFRTAVASEPIDLLPASTKAASPDPSRHPLSPVQPQNITDGSLIPEAGLTTKSKEPAVDGGGIKKRKKPRAVPTSSAPRQRSPTSSLRSPKPGETVDIVVPDSQAVEESTVQREGKGKKGKERAESTTTSKKKRKILQDEEAEVVEKDQKEEKRKKVVRKASLAGKATVLKGEEQTEEARNKHTKGSGSSKYQEIVKDKPTKKREAEEVGKPKPEKRRKSEPVVTESPRPSLKEPAKKKRTKTVAARQTSPSPRRSPTSPAALTPPPLSLSPTFNATTSRNSNKKQLIVRSERLETDFSVEAKVNAFDVLVGATKDGFKDWRGDLEEDDEGDKAKIDTLQGFVATLRLSLLHRSADISEYSSLQRRLTSSKATSKRLKAEVDELKEKTKKQK